MSTSATRLARLAVTGALLLLVTAPAAFATPPGENGKIAFRRYLGPDRTHGAIFVINPDGSGERQVTDPPPGYSDDFPDLGANGSLIAFQRCGELTCRIMTVRPDGTSLKQVGPGCVGDEEPPQCADVFYPAVAPGGKRIAFVRAFGTISDDLIDHVGIYVMRTDGTHVRRVTLPRTRTAEDGQPQWSPDGRGIVFVRYNITAKPAGQQAIHTVKANGSRLRRVTPWALTAGDGPDWSPDGSRILFRAPETEDFLNSNLYTIRVDGKRLRQLTYVPPTTKIYSSSFSPDGTSITFGMMGVADAADVFTMRLDGSAPQPITRTPEWDSAPDWGSL